MKYITPNAQGIRKILLKADLDWVHITDGYEGVGKTTFTWQLCKTVDPTFNTNHIIFTEDQFRHAIKTSKPGNAYMLDEGALILFKRDAMRKENKKIIRLLTTVRANNLFLAINAPDFLNLLDKYIIEHRVRSVARVVKRGWVHWFSKTKIPLINFNQKTKKYEWPEPTFRDTFPKVTGTDWELYKRRKSGVVDRETDYLTVSELATKLHKTPTTIYSWIKKNKLKVEKDGTFYMIPYEEYIKLEALRRN